MITKCRFCGYHKKSPLSLDILKVMHSDPDIPFEDWALWGERLVKSHGLSDYNGVKIHMGRMHKDKAYKYISPDISFEPEELEIINKIA